MTLQRFENLKKEDLNPKFKGIIKNEKKALKQKCKELSLSAYEKANKNDFMPEIFNDNFQNFKRYNLPKAQILIADIPYNIGINAYASNPQWYKKGNRSEGESKYAKARFFQGDGEFNLNEFLHFATKILKKEPKQTNQAPVMLIFCAFNQQFHIIEKAKQYGFKKYINLVFVKNYSPSVLKSNQRLCGNLEYGLLLFRDKLPKFNNDGKMIFSSFEYPRNLGMPRIHPTQKPLSLLERLISIFSDKGEIIIDCCAGSGSSLIAAANIGRKAYGFEIKKEFCEKIKNIAFKEIERSLF